MTRSLLSAALLLGLASCAPMTFSKSESVDFDAYPSVRIQLGGPDGARRHLEYLETELRAHSGFARVTSDPIESASAVLEVDLELSSSGGGYDVFDDEVEEISYSGYADYRLFAVDRRLIDGGEESVESESTSFDAAESALDLVVYHYLRQYRF
jgi:hypothetical protein